MIKIGSKVKLMLSKSDRLNGSIVTVISKYKHHEPAWNVQFQNGIIDPFTESNMKEIKKENQQMNGKILNLGKQFNFKQ